MVHESNRSSRNGTPTAELEELNLASNRNSPSPTPLNNTMIQSSSPSPSGTPPPPPSSGLKFSFSKGAAPVKPTLKTPSKLSNGITAFHGHDDSDSEDEYRKTSKVTHLENGTVVGEQPVKRKEEKKPLVIKPPESHNEHWLQRRLKMFRPDMVDSQPPENVDLSSIPDRIGDGSGKAGLQLTKRPSTSPEPTEEQEVLNDMQVDNEAAPPPKTEDELARELLLRQATDPNAGLSTQARLIIPARTEPLTESDVYAYDMAHLSDAPTLETYERVPVEAFGMGILLGLGWKEGTDLHGNKAEKFKEPKKRPDFLGIGAKEEEFLRMDAKGQKLSRKDGLGGSWNPLKKINKETGEVIVEDSKESRRGTPKDRPSGVNTLREGSQYGTPSAGGGYDSARERDRDRRRDDDRDRRIDKYRDDDRDRRERRYDSDRESKRRDREYDSDRDSRRRDREYDSDRDLKRKDRGYDSDRKPRDREYDSDHDRKRRRERQEDRGMNGSHRSSRRPSRSPSRKDNKSREGLNSKSTNE
jgi:G-patch domain